MEDTKTAPRTFEEAQDILAAKLPGYAKRTHQIALAEQMEQVIAAEGTLAEGHAHLLAQAGTGTGKSLAYLIACILSGKRTIVATATKTLQGQISGKDIPFLLEHLGVDFKAAVIKGRANYPCHERIRQIEHPTPGQAHVIARVEELSTPEAVRDLKVVDREDFPELPEAEWRDFSMSSEECPGASLCPFGEVCLAQRAKARAAEADVVITNTAYLLRDLKLRQMSGGNVALLGDVELIVIDEAHVLPEVATSALEDTLMQGGIAKLSRDMAAYMNRMRLDVTLAEVIEPAASALWAEVADRYLDFARRNRGNYDPMPLSQAVLIRELGSYFAAVTQAVDAAKAEILTQRAFDDDTKMARSRLLRRADNITARLTAYTMSPDDETVRWAIIEKSLSRSGPVERLYLRSAPVSVGPFLREAMWDVVPTFLVSATLAPAKDFSYMERQVGLRKGEASAYNAGSPFDYRKQVTLFTPDKNQPDPSKNEAAWRSYTQGVAKFLVEAGQGGALLLFTSRRAMNEAYDAMAAGFRSEGLHVMRQGDAPNGELIRMMKEDGNAVLFALRSFFEGVDVPGDALRLVVIDRLPFAPPTDLVRKARKAVLVREHGNEMAGFNYLDVPGMMLILEQGFGRLIRTVEDKGVVAILDPRLNSKFYGSRILAALPDAARTSNPREAAEFLRQSR